MEINLTSVGMEKGKQYETIISSSDLKNHKNAAPIGIICSGKDKVLCRIFKGGKTLDNILSKKEFVINITHDPELFFKTTVGNLPQDNFSEEGFINNADAYAKCRVISFKEAVKQSDPVKKNGEAIVIKSEVVEMKIFKPVSALNRGFGYVIECLINYSRFDLFDESEKEEFIAEFREARRVVNKVGYKSDIASLNLIKKELLKKGYDL